MALKQRDTKDWIKQIAAHMGMSVSDLARRAGMAPSTLTRYINDASEQVGISQKTLDLISSFSGYAPHQLPNARPAGGLAEPDALPLATDGLSEHAPWLAAAVAAALAGRNGRDAWIMRGRALDMAGVQPGDVLVVDLNMRPRAGDIVCAQVYDWSRGRAETVIRIYEPPFLITRSSLPINFKPLVVDEDAVQIRGVVDAVIRGLRH